MNQIVEIARFYDLAKAQMLRNVLENEGIPSFLKDELSGHVLASFAAVGGIKVEIREEDVPRALEIMKENGFEIPSESDEAETLQPIETFLSKIPLFKGKPLEKQILLLLVCMAVTLGILIALAYFI